MTNAMKNFVGIAPGTVYGWPKMRGYPPRSGNPLIPNEPTKLRDGNAALSGMLPYLGATYEIDIATGNVTKLKTFVGRQGTQRRGFAYDGSSFYYTPNWSNGNDAAVELERMMAVGQAVVGIGRSLRQDSGIKTRQPLGRLVAHASDDRIDLLLSNDQLRDYVCEELNIKAVETVADPREIARLGAKANFRALGPRFGKGAPVAAKRITAMTPAEIMELKAQGTVSLDFEGQPTDFTFEEVMVVEEGLAPFVAGSGQGLTVALDITLTDDLLAEGLCREIINKIQNLRKSSGLEVSDRINLDISGSDHVLAVVERFAARIQTDTLADSVACSEELPYKEALTIAENEIGIALGKV